MAFQVIVPLVEVYPRVCGGNPTDPHAESNRLMVSTAPSHSQMPDVGLAHAPEFSQIRRYLVPSSPHAIALVDIPNAAMLVLKHPLRLFPVASCAPNQSPLSAPIPVSPHPATAAPAIPHIPWLDVAQSRWPYLPDTKTHLFQCRAGLGARSGKSVPRNPNAAQLPMC